MAFHLAGAKPIIYVNLFALRESIPRLLNEGSTAMTACCAPACSQALPVKPQGVWARGIEAWARSRDRRNWSCGGGGLFGALQRNVPGLYVGILLFGPLGTNFSEILIKIFTFSFKNMHLNMSSRKLRSFCLGLNVLTYPSINFTIKGRLHQRRR